METLANIALAAARLEELETSASSKTSLGQDFIQERRQTPTTVSGGDESRVVVAPPPPMKHFFGTTPRLVSIDTSTDSAMLEPHTSTEDDLDVIVDYDSDSDPPPPPPFPDETITHVLDDDVLCGRGGETNHHTGNVRYRALVKKYQRMYLKAKRRDKPRIARRIVDTVRCRGGRFLKKDPGSNHTYRDVGNNKAREKTSQALREGAPELRVEGGSSLSSGDDVSYQQHTTTAHYKQPSVVETSPTSQSKKRKQQESIQHMGAVLVSPTPSNSSYGSQGFVATVSADDDDQGSDQGGAATGKPIRGPRLAILKKRLMLSEAD